MPLSFISNFTNLQELTLSLGYDYFGDFEKLQHVTFSQLKSLKFLLGYPNHEYLIKFLEINGKYLERFDIECFDNSLNLAIAKFCPNLKSLLNIFRDKETLKIIFNNCQRLESIRVFCGEYNLKELLDVIAKYSPKHVSELKIYYTYVGKSEALPKTLESFLISWANRISHKSLSLIIVSRIEVIKKDMEVIEKYKKLGVIKNFEVVVGSVGWNY